MLKVKVVDKQGKTVGEVDIDPNDFGGEVNKQLLHDVVIQYLANQRAGTHSTLRRGEVAGSTKKLFRQKGTGNARAGTKRTNKRRGGGTAKGPKPRDYEYHMPKKMVQAATRMAILSKLQDNEALVIEDFDLPKTKNAAGDSLVKTKEMAGVIKSITKAIAPVQPELPAPVAGEKPRKKQFKGFTWLVGTAGVDKTLHQATRNIADVKLMPASEFNAYTILRQKRLLLTRAALDELRSSGSKSKVTQAGK